MTARLAKTKTSWLSNWSIGNIVLLSASTFVALLVVELAFRTFAPLRLTGGYIGAYKYDEILGVRLKDNIHWFKTTDYQQEIKTNRLGTVNFQDSFNRGASLVFAIGDSFTQGTGLPADASYPFQLDLILNQSNDGEYSSKYEIVNLGLSAFGAKQELLSLGLYSQKIGKPEYVLYLGSDNDLEDDLRFETG